jgi:hypothetical protein
MNGCSRQYEQVLVWLDRCTQNYRTLVCCDVTPTRLSHSCRSRLGLYSYVAVRK